MTSINVEDGEKLENIGQTQMRLRSQSTDLTAAETQLSDGQNEGAIVGRS